MDIIEAWLIMSKPKDSEYGTWILAEREFEKQRPLTDQDTILDIEPTRLYTPLLPHQKATVKAMLDLEKRRFVRIKELKNNSYWNQAATKLEGYDSPVVETTAGVISEKLGSGKSFEIMALISISPIPRSVAEISRLDFPRSNVNRYGGNIVNGYGLEVRRSYSKLLRQTVIFVGKSVLLQWAQYIEDYSDFKALLIKDIRDLLKLYKMILSNEKGLDRKALNKYDIIIVKNGNITGKSFGIPELKGTDLADMKTKPILTIFGEIFQQYRFARIVLDDFDTINIPVTAKSVPALFTWFVSSTKKSWMGNAKHVGRKFRTIREIATFYRPTYVETSANPDLFNYFNICTDDKFVNASTNVGKTDYWTYQFDNPNETYISLLGTMGTQDAANVMEMLNGDAVETAAEAAGNYYQIGRGHL